MAEAASMAGGIRRAFAHLPRRRRWQGAAVVGLTLIGAVAEAMTIGAVLPFLALLADPGAVQKHRWLAAALSLLGPRAAADPIVALAILFCVVAVCAAAIRIVIAWASQKFVFRIGFDLGLALYERLLHQRYAFHVSQNSSRLLSRINGIQTVLTGMLLPMVQAFTSLVIACFIVAGLLLVNATVAITSALSFSAIYLGVSLATRNRLRRNGQIAAEGHKLRLKAVQEGLGGIRDVLLDGAQPIHLRKFAAIDTRLRNAQAATALIGAVPRFAVEGLGMVLIVLLALVLSGGGGDIDASLPVLGALAIGAQRLLPLLQFIYTGWTSMMGNRAMFFDVLDLLDQPMPLDRTPRKAIAPMPFERAVTFRNVEFRYADGGALVLDGIDLEIARGSRVGFVGRTGSGKSTIMDLTMGLLRPTGGSIEVDGVPLDEGNLASWQAQIAHVPQHIYLSDESFAENVAFGVPEREIDHDRVVAACRKADIHDFIAAQPDGYGSHVGERGVRLSGGQRQRIGIARALYKKSSLLVLDEATSALDEETEAAVIAAVERLGRGHTILMIAHRVSTLRGCDVVFRLDGGRIVQRGGFAEVVGDPKWERIQA